VRQVLHWGQKEDGMVEEIAALEEQWVQSVCLSSHCRSRTGTRRHAYRAAVNNTSRVDGLGQASLGGRVDDATHSRSHRYRRSLLPRLCRWWSVMAVGRRVE
jgi:hypothetical protein